jgi:hypothetical protein
MAPYGVPQHPVHSGLLSGLRIRFSHLAMALLHVNDWPYEDLIPLGSRCGMGCCCSVGRFAVGLRVTDDGGE